MNVGVGPTLQHQTTLHVTRAPHNQTPTHPTSLIGRAHGPPLVGIVRFAGEKLVSRLTFPNLQTVLVAKSSRKNTNNLNDGGLGLRQKLQAQSQHLSTPK